MAKSTPSEKRRAANRKNAQKSTGPRTEAGKARASQNARKQEFRADSYTIVGAEQPDDVARLIADFVGVFQPQNAAERAIIDTIGVSHHELLRSHRLGAGIFTNILDEVLSGDREGYHIPPLSKEIQSHGEATSGQHGSNFLAEGFRRLDQTTWTGFLRYQAQTERMNRQAWEKLKYLWSIRDQLPDPLPEPPEVTSLTPVTPPLTSPLTQLPHF